MPTVCSTDIAAIDAAIRTTVNTAYIAAQCCAFFAAQWSTHDPTILPA